ncbi:MAG: hypothetical protein KDA63_08540 [Planctomycetales bacterium]|nr:hypothetical protein [Planctomycetales bacterium]
MSEPVSPRQSSDDRWSPERDDATHRPAYLDDLYRRRAEAQIGRGASSADGYNRPVSYYEEELPPGREQPHQADRAFEDYGNYEYSDGYAEEGPIYGPDGAYPDDTFFGPGEQCGPDGCDVPYGGYSVDSRPSYFIPPGNWYWWDDFTIFGGVHGFKGPLDDGRNGNFGFHEGLNWGGPLWDYMQIGYQVGAQVAHSNFHGDQVYSPDDDGRTQYFVTAGLFHRADGCGLQLGIVCDWLEDDYFGQINLTQLRGEISYVFKNQNEIGIWTATNTDEANISPEVLAVSNLPASVRSADMFNAFWRTRFGQRGEGRLWAGASSGGNVVFGGEIRVPLAKNFALESSFNYLSADGENGRYDNSAESWSTVINLVWYPGWTACRSGKHPYRPLFNVADNTTFMIDPNQTDGDRWVLSNVEAQ